MKRGEREAATAMQAEKDMWRKREVVARKE